MAQEIRIGIIGAGNNTRIKHIPNLDALEDVEIVAVVNRTRESSRQVAEQFGVGRVYDEWQQAIDDPDTNAIVIGTWPYLHRDATVAALNAGKHVMCEARMARNAREAHDMLDAAEKHPELVAQVVPAPHTLRVDPMICKLVADGFLGELRAVEVCAGGGFADPSAPMNWRQDVALSGLNTMSLGIWYEAVMRWIGPAKRVLSNAATFVPQRPDAEGNPTPIEIPDHLCVLTDMECGAQGLMRFSNVIGLADNSAWLFGSDGTIKFAGGMLYGGQRDDDALKVIDLPTDYRGEWRVEEEFVNAIRGNEKIKLTDFATGVKYMEFTEAVARSRDSGQAVELPLKEL